MSCLCELLFIYRNFSKLPTEDEYHSGYQVFISYHHQFQSESNLKSAVDVGMVWLYVSARMWSISSHSQILGICHQSSHGHCLHSIGLLEFNPYQLDLLSQDHHHKSGGRSNSAKLWQ